MPSSKQPPNRRATLLLSIGSAFPLLERRYRAVADKAVGHIGLSQAMAWPLVTLSRHGDGQRPGELADALGVEPASLVRQLDQLLSAGLIERHGHAVDRRAKTLHLTASGKAAVSKIEAALHAMRAELFEGASDADLEACLRVFSTLGSHLGRVSRKPVAVPA